MIKQLKKSEDLTMIKKIKFINLKTLSLIVPLLWSLSYYPVEATKPKQEAPKGKSPAGASRKKAASPNKTTLNKAKGGLAKQTADSSLKKEQKIVSSSTSAPAPQSNQPKLLGTYGQWRAYEAQEGGKKVCYMTSFPQKENGNYAKRGDVYMVLAHRPSLQSFDVISFDAGYALKKGSQIDVQVIGDKTSKFKLFTEKETAWCADCSTDKKLAEALTKGTKIVVAGESEKGTKTEDTYSLAGSTAAYNAICKACNVKKG